MTLQGGHDEPERGVPRACTPRRPPSRAPLLHATRPFSACPLSAFNACTSRRKAQACLQADRRAKATGAEQHGQQARPAPPCGPPARALAPSTPTRTPIRTPTQRLLPRAACNASQILAFTSLPNLLPLAPRSSRSSGSSGSSLLAPLAPLLPPLLLLFCCALCCSVVAVRSHVGRGCAFMGRAWVGPLRSRCSALSAPLSVLRSRCSALSFVAPLAAYVQIPSTCACETALSGAILSYLCAICMLSVCYPRIEPSSDSPCYLDSYPNSYFSRQCGEGDEAERHALAALRGEGVRRHQDFSVVSPVGVDRRVDKDEL